MAVTILAALEAALDRLEIEAGWEPSDFLARILLRRRHSLRLLRRALRGRVAAEDRAPVQAAAGTGDIGALVAAEERLAALLDHWIEALGCGHPLRALADHLRAETDDAARALRVLQSRRAAGRWH